MGFLYTWEEVRDRRIPSPEDFDQVGFEVMEALYSQDGVAAASMYGSVLRGEQNSRSDLDLAVIARDLAIREVLSLVGELTENARESHNVIISSRIHSVSQALRAEHKFGPSYRRTFARLQKQGRGKGQLHKLIACVDDDIDREMLDKLALNRQRVAKAEYLFRIVTKESSQRSVNTWLARCKQGSLADFRPFHLYVNIARWLLWSQEHDLPDDSKRIVVERILSEPAFDALREEFALLAALDQEYDDLLKAVVLGKVERKTYLSRVGHMVRELFTHIKQLIHKASVYMRSKERRKTQRLQVAV